MTEQTRKKTGWEILKNAADAVIALPPLGSGDLLSNVDRPALVGVLGIQCFARAEELIPKNHLPEVLEAILGAVTQSNISAEFEIGFFLAHQVDDGAVSGCLKSMNLESEWAVGHTPHSDAMLITQKPEIALDLVKKELIAIFKKTGIKAPPEIESSFIEAHAKRIVDKGHLCEEVITIMTVPQLAAHLIGTSLSDQSNILEVLEREFKAHPRWGGIWGPFGRKTH